MYQAKRTLLLIRSAATTRILQLDNLLTIMPYPTNSKRSLYQTLYSDFSSFNAFFPFIADRSQSLVDYAYKVQRFAFQESTKRNMRSQLQAYLNFCVHYKFSPFPVSKRVFLAYLVFLSHSLTSYQSLLNYINILKHINNALGADLAFMSNYDCFLTQQGLRRVMGDRSTHTFPIVVDILLRILQSFQPHNVFHACMRAAFLVAFFSFLRISNLVPYTLSEAHYSTSFFLRRRDITFTPSGAYLQIFKTKIIQFKQRIVEIPLPFIPNSIMCPVTALANYFKLVHASPESPVFLAPHGSGFTPVLGRHFNLFLKHCVSSIGEDPSHFSLRSFNKGGATFAFNCGAPTEFIKAQGDWKSDAYLVYLTLSTSKKQAILNAIATKLTNR